MNLAFIEQVIRVEKTMFFSNFNFSIVSQICGSFYVILGGVLDQAGFF